MEQLSLWAPSIAGVFAIAITLASAHWIVGRPTNSAAAEPEAAQEAQFPFEFTPPLVPTEAEGSISARMPESVH